MNPYQPSHEPILAQPAPIKALVCTLRVINDVIRIAAMLRPMRKDVIKSLNVAPPPYQAYWLGIQYLPSGRYGDTGPICLVTQWWPCINLLVKVMCTVHYFKPASNALVFLLIIIEGTATICMLG